MTLGLAVATTRYVERLGACQARQFARLRGSSLTLQLDHVIDVIAIVERGTEGESGPST
jgi:hypothetical protein